MTRHDRISTRPHCPSPRGLALTLVLAACDLLPDDDADPQQTTGATTSETTAAATTGDALCMNDAWEPNNDADDAASIIWSWADNWQAYHEIEGAHLCPGEDDWYRFDVAGLNYSEHYLYVRGLVKGAGLCGAGCGEPVIPPGPEHAMTIEVYRGDTLEPLTAQTADHGVLALGGWGEEYSHSLLIRVYSPTATAAYPYRLTVDMRNYDGEDECEC